MLVLVPVPVPVLLQGGYCCAISHGHMDLIRFYDMQCLCLVLNLVGDVDAVPVCALAMRAMRCDEVGVRRGGG